MYTAIRFPLSSEKNFTLIQKAYYVRSIYSQEHMVQVQVEKPSSDQNIGFYAQVTVKLKAPRSDIILKWPIWTFSGSEVL